MVPADPAPVVLAGLFTDRLGRLIKVSDLGYVEDARFDLGLTWAPTTRATVGAVADLWRADMERRAVLLGSAWTATAFAVPACEWLLDWSDELTGNAGGRRVGATEVDAVWSMCHAFADTDLRLGDGSVRTTLVHYLNQTVLPLLDGTYSDEVGRLLMAATARLCNLAGFMAFDSDAQGLGQRHYIQALRLARAGRDRALGAHILGDMAKQAHYLGHGVEACTLARAGQRAAREAGSYASVARCCAMEARAHAHQGDDRQCGQAMRRAELALDRVRVEVEPVWIRFFTATQLQAEFTFATAELGRSKDVRSFATPVLAVSNEQPRRRVLVTATLASSYLGVAGSGIDVDRACATLGETVPLVAVPHTERAVTAVNAVRRQLAPYGDQGPVRELEAAFTPLIGTATRTARVTCGCSG